MDATKLRIVAGVGAAILGIAAVGVLSAGAVFALAPTMGTAAAAGVVGAALLVLAGICLIAVARPDVTTEEEVEEIEKMTADALADLPFETVKALVEQRPVASIAVAMATGFALSRDPGGAVRHLRRALTWLS